MKLFNFLVKIVHIQYVVEVVLILLISLPTFWSLLRPGYFPMHDDMQVMRVYEMTKCFKDWQIPCRWVPDMGYGFGYPQFNYYGPLPYYVMTFSHLLGFGYIDATKFGVILALILGNLSMFYLAKYLFGKYGGYLSTLVYAYAPYRASDIYSRGAMGESWGFVFFPLITLFLKKTIDKPNLKNALLLSLGIAGLLISHNVSTVVFLPFITILTLILLVLKNGLSLQKYLNQLKHLALGGILAICFSAFFFLPVLFERKFVHIESMIGGYFDYRAHFVSLSQLFVSNFWGYGSSVIGIHDDLAFFHGSLLMSLVLVSGLICLINLFKKTYIQQSIIAFSTIGLALMSTFMVHEKSSFIWSTFPSLAYLQFPWRYLVASNFFFPLSIGIVMLNLKLTRQKILMSIMVPAFLLINGSFFFPKSWINITDYEKLNGYLWDKQKTISIFDYLPKSSEFPPVFPAFIFPKSTTKEISYLNYLHGSNWFKLKTVSMSPAQITLPQLDFPGWKVYINSKLVVHQSDEKLGYIIFSVPSGENDIYVKLTDTPIRLFGNILSIMTVILSIYFVFRKNKEQ